MKVIAYRHDMHFDRKSFALNWIIYGAKNVTEELISFTFKIADFVDADDAISKI